MEQERTPPWAKRMEEKIDKLLMEKTKLETCYHHKKYGADAKKKCDPPCAFVLSLEKKNNPATLSPIVNSILQYMKPIQAISPLKKRKGKLEDDLEPIGTYGKMKKPKDGGRM